MKPSELKLCGLAAVRARFARDPDSIRRLYFDYDTGRQVGVISKVLAQKKKIYRCVEPAELEKIGGTVHHGGIVAVVAAPELPAPRAGELAGWAAARACVLLLDRIGNPHNFGAIARTAAFFGVKRIVIPAHPDAALPGDAAYRVAEGGFEALTVYRVPDLVKFARELAAAGFEVVGAATRGGKMTAEKNGRPIALVLGNEEQGLDPKLAAACTRLVTIPGSKNVESLNVSAAAAVLIWEVVAAQA